MYVIKIALMGISLLAAHKKRESLIYLIYFVIPFFPLGVIRALNISGFDILKWACVVPMIIMLVLDFLIYSHEQRRGFINIVLIIVTAYVYMFTKYSDSLEPFKLNFMRQIAVGMVIFIYVIYNYRHIEIKKLLSVTKLIIVIQIYMAVQESKGINIVEIVPFIDVSQDYIKQIKLSTNYRASGSMNDPNWYALYMAMLSGFIVVDTKKISNHIFFFAGIFATLLSGSRMGLLMVAVLMIVYLKSKLSLKSYSEAAKSVLLAMAICAFAAYFLMNHRDYPLIANILERFTHVDMEQTKDRDFILYTYFTRILNMDNFLFGLGFENFRFAMEEDTGYNIMAHNQYVEMLSDFGVFIFVPFVLLVVYVIQRYGLQWGKNPYRYAIIMVLFFGNMFLTTTYEMNAYLYWGLFTGWIIENSKRTKYSIDTGRL